MSHNIFPSKLLPSLRKNPCSFIYHDVLAIGSACDTQRKDAFVVPMVTGTCPRGVIMVGTAAKEQKQLLILLTIMFVNL